ncbi:cytochrome c oxidase subunit 5b-1, mitochondrial-like [Heracleum sosnowskyi]|uniref:Cytochrome c oxidase subunit 5b-1, mitochondrial-like n=1 Tax=Heracleum sosnowskyi TaxID=360622 RepID=A0AAD8M9I6_9APIA|nr:cytochrome c oxidase subunit 5b-1, mitochondrial-like [Heracleum sosnowskyi]
MLVYSYLSNPRIPVLNIPAQEAPAVVKSYYDKRIVGCPGVDGEDEHDVVWFWLEKGKPHECPVCSQYFVPEVVGPGGPQDGHAKNGFGPFYALFISYHVSFLLLRLG